MLPFGLWLKVMGYAKGVLGGGRGEEAAVHEEAATKRMMEMGEVAPMKDSEFKRWWFHRLRKHHSQLPLPSMSLQMC